MPTAQRCADSRRALTIAVILSGLMLDSPVRPVAAATRGDEMDASRHLRAVGEDSARHPAAMSGVAVVVVAACVIVAIAAFAFGWSCKKKKDAPAPPSAHTTNSSEPEAAAIARFEQFQDARENPRRPRPAPARADPPQWTRAAPPPQQVAPPQRAHGQEQLVQPQQWPSTSSGSLPSNANSSSSSGPPSARPSPGERINASMEDESIRALRVPYEEITCEELLSRGGYGEVYRGRFRNEVVALKMLLPERRKDRRQVDKFLAEVKLMAAMKHKRIVRFVGVAWQSFTDLCVLSEFMERGDLRTVLFAFENSNLKEPGFDEDKLRIARHVAHGLDYMHSMSPVVLHRDLKSRNILLDAELNAKLTDFGVSRERADTTMTAAVGTYLWMAPEVMTGQRYDEKADIFSLGIVLSELDTHTVPYEFVLDTSTDKRLPDRVLLEMVAHGRLQVAFTDYHSPMTKLARKCLSVNPDDRPTAKEVLRRITQIWHLEHMSS